MSNRRTLFCLGAFALVVSFSGAALADAVGVTSPTSKLNCRTVQETHCTADAHGNISNCHTVPVTECTVVSGPGSGVSSVMGGSGPAVGPKGNLFHSSKAVGAVPLLHRR